MTIMHHNENCQRNVKLTKDGKPFGKIKRSKATKLIPTVQYIREDPTYGNHLLYYLYILQGLLLVK